MIILGLDPGLAHTGWGVVRCVGNNLSYVACGRVSTSPKLSTPERLALLYAGIQSVVETHKPEAAAVEEVFVNNNARSSLVLGQARGISLLVPTQAGLEVAEYAALQIKKSLVGYGRAEKSQVGHMVQMLLPTAKVESEDAADALAVAITHSHHLQTRQRLAG